jgi:hypothetical protein
MKETEHQRHLNDIFGYTSDEKNQVLINENKQDYELVSAIMDHWIEWDSKDDAKSIDTTNKINSQVEKAHPEMWRQFCQFFYSTHPFGTPREFLDKDNPWLLEDIERNEK